MSAPDVHMVVLVHVASREVLVDSGYAAPFFEPMPRDLDQDHVVSFGRDRYVLRPRDTHGRSRLDQHREGERIHGYAVNPEPRSLDHFAGVVSDSYSDAAAFMNSVVVVRFWPGRMLRLHNQTVIEACADRVSVRKLEHREQIPETVEQLFAIPAALVEQALTDVGEWADIYT